MGNGEWSGGSPVCRQNVALAQTASQSDTLWDYTAGLAVDGEENSTCSFTPRTPDQRWWQVQLKEAINIESVAVAINAKTFQKFTIFVIELLEDSKALYKPCSRFEGIYEESRAVFLCNQGDGHRGFTNHCRIHSRNNLGNNSRKLDKVKFAQESLFTYEMTVRKRITWDYARFRCFRLWKRRPVVILSSR